MRTPRNEVGEADGVLLDPPKICTSPLQVRAALGYYQLYPDEIDLRPQAEAAWTPERIRRELPFLAPSRSPVPHPIQPLTEGSSSQLELIEVDVMPRLVEQVEGGVRVVA